LFSSKPFRFPSNLNNGFKTPYQNKVKQVWKTINPYIPNNDEKKKKEKNGRVGDLPSVKDENLLGVEDGGRGEENEREDKERREEEDVEITT
jgi:hypothetical protein